MRRCQEIDELKAGEFAVLRTDAATGILANSSGEYACTDEDKCLYAFENDHLARAFILGEICQLPLCCWYLLDHRGAQIAIYSDSLAYGLERERRLEAYRQANQFHKLLYQWFRRCLRRLLPGK